MALHLFVLCFGVLTFSVLPGSSEDSVVSTRFVVTFHTASDNGNVTLAELEGVRVLKQYGRRLVLDVGSTYNLEDMQRTLLIAKLRAVQSVEIDYLVNTGQMDLLVEDPLAEASSSNSDVDEAMVSSVSQTPLWNIKDDEPYSIHVESVWKVTNSTPNVVVAVVDTGMAELAKSAFLNLLDGYDFISDDGISMDGDGRDQDSTDPGDWGDMCPTPSWHGTKVASILAARHDNRFGMRGIAQNCAVLPVRVLGLCRMGYATDVTDAIVWAAGGVINGVPKNPNPAKIISLSLAGEGQCPNYLQSAVTQAINQGALIIAAAGNNRKNVSRYFPANCEGVIAVAASTREGKLAAYSNWGSLITFFAPGGDSINAIMTMGVDELKTGLEVAYGMGTSFAAPHVAGVAALYMGYNNIIHKESLLTRLNTYILSHSIIIDCTQYSCDNGILPGQPEQKQYQTLNQSFVETFSKWNETKHVFGVNYNVPPGNRAGNVLGTNGNAYAWSNGVAASVGQYFHQCGAGQYICVFFVYIDNAVRGFAYECCNMYNEVTYRSPCIGWCQDAWIGMTYHGWFKSITMVWDGYRVAPYYNTVQGELWGRHPGSAAVNAATCPENMYVNGIYGNYGTTMDVNYVFCRPMFVPCPVGHYSLYGPDTSDGGGAIPCDVGFFSANVGAIYCSYCTEGTYLAVEGGSSCIACPSGSYAYIIYASVCTSCSPGSYNNVASASSAEACIPCPVNTYSALARSTYCTNCPASYFSNPGSSVCKISSKCSAGQRPNSVYDAPSSSYTAYCPAGQYVCGYNFQACTASFFYCCSLGGSQTGYWTIFTSGFSGSINNGAMYTSTSSGYPPLPWSTVNTANTFSGITGTNSNPYGISITTDVVYSLGSQQNTANYVVTCSAGKVVTGFNGYFGTCIGAISAVCNTPCVACSVCPIGSYTSTACTTSSDVVCGLCSAGKYSVTAGVTGCILCPSGSYSPNNGVSVCVLCATGTFSTALGSLSSATCGKCFSGTYNSGTGRSACTSCLPGQYSSLQGLSECYSCAAGRYSTALNAIDTSICTACPAGTYSSKNGASASSVCQLCQSGKFSTLLGATSLTACLDCSSTQCILPGQYSTCGNGTSGECSLCQNIQSTGTTYYAVSGISSFCLSKNSIKGSFRNCTNPRAPMQIFYMIFKTTLLDFGSLCVFQGSRNSQPYYMCLSSDFSPYYVWWQGTLWMGSTVLDDMSIAEAGPGVDGKTYVSGEYQPIMSLYSNLLDNSVAWEIPCSPGSYASTEGSTACTLASAGYYVSSSGSSSQTPCAANLYSYAGASACTVSCPVGTYMAASGSQCLVVSPGSYSITGISTPCPKGTYSNFQGATACTNCIAGQYNSGTGMDSPTSCVLCAQGTYASSAASPNCTACSAGKYSTATGSTLQCGLCTTACPAGRQLQGACTPTSDAYCTQCTPVTNCFYIAGTPCGNATNPNCLCLPGFELLTGQCQPCKAGFFKGANSSLPCTLWNTSQVCGQGYYLANGTRFTNAACLLSCPTPPGNATAKNSVTGCGWGCKAGYNNTVFK